jgi:NAD(P)-dependent dehydrogenase (short-subunit alcohol dehydrogenase family)
MSAANGNRTVLVTGSSRGIGRAIAEAFFAAGHRVAFNGRDADVLGKAVEGKPAGRAVAVGGDVTQPEAARNVVARTLAAFGGLDVLVCNVGSGRSVPPGEEQHDEWLRMLSLNLLSTTNMVEAAREALAAIGGNVICISSICGQEVVPGAPVTYGVAKAALNAYIRGAARPLGEQGIRINGIAPGNMLFPGSVWERKLAADSDGVNAMLKRDVALGRLGRPEEVAGMALWLASPEASFTTGGIFVIDGGQVRS